MDPHHLYHNLFIFMATVILIHGPSSSSADNYDDCGKNFTCGSIGVGYPFWGPNRPEHCGQPSFELNCTNNVPYIRISEQDYRVLEIDVTSRNLKVVRTDYLNNVCPQTGLHNTTSVLPFSYTTSDAQVVTLFYSCTTPPMFGGTTSAPNSFDCTAAGGVATSYFIVGQVSSGSMNNMGTCMVSVEIPVYQSEATIIESSETATVDNLIKVVNAGFGLTWEANINTLCDACLSNKTRCGYDGGLVCYSGQGTGNSGPISVGAGVGIGGAGLFLIVVGFYIFFLLQRRKKKRALLAKSKDLPTPPSSKSLPTTSINFSQSIPSYPSSKSDLERGNLEKGSTYFGVQVFSYTELEEATDNFNPSRELGEGGFGTVYYGNLSDGRVVAVKRLYENNFKRVEQFMNEVEILTRLQHKNLVKLYGCTSRRSRELLLVYEYIPNGTVADHLHGKRSSSGLLSWPVRMNIAIETAEALAYLHKSDTIHRDVKTNNILLDNNFCVKVADFGLSRLFPNDVTHVSTAPQGTPGYVDPEYYQCYQLTDKSDVYSFGVVLAELVSSLQAVDTNRHRHDINLANMVVSKIQNHSFSELVDPGLGFETNEAIRRMTTAVSELAFRCLQQERDMRPSMDEVVKVLKAIKNEEFELEKAEVVDIVTDEIGLLKNLPPPLSPDSVMPDKWVSSSTTPSSF